MKKYKKFMYKIKLNSLLLYFKFKIFISMSSTWLAGWLVGYLDAMEYTAAVMLSFHLFPQFIAKLSRGHKIICKTKRYATTKQQQ